MKRRSFLFGISLLAFVQGLPAQVVAGSITIQVIEAGQSNATKTFTLPDAQIDRIVAAYQVAANASVNGPATRAQVLNYLAVQLIQGAVVQYVLGIETQNATAAAQAGVSPINPQ